VSCRVKVLCIVRAPFCSLGLGFRVQRLFGPSFIASLNLLAVFLNCVNGSYIEALKFAFKQPLDWSPWPVTQQPTLSSFCWLTAKCAEEHATRSSDGNVNLSRNWGELGDNIHTAKGKNQLRLTSSLMNYWYRGWWVTSAPKTIVKK